MASPDSAEKDLPATAARAEAGSPRPFILLGCVLAWLGALICFLLLEKSAGVRSLLCRSEMGCEAVLGSNYASLRGVPLPWIGAAFYLVLLAGHLVADGTRSKDRRLGILKALHWVTIAGLSFSVFLMYVQFGVLKAFCPLCTASALVMVALAFSTAKAAGAATAGEDLGLRSEAIVLGCMTALAAAAFAMGGLPAPPEVVAVVDGQEFTRAQMEEDLRAALDPLRQNVHALEVAWARRKVEEALLAGEAARAGTSVGALLSARAEALGAVSEKEIEARLAGQGLPPTAQNVEAARTALAAERRERARSELLQELLQTHSAAIHLQRPAPQTMQVDLSTAKTSGPADAAVQLVVFSDFQCQFCARFAPVLKRVRDEYPQVLVAYRYFPLESHDRAFTAAVAAECAAEQDAFWPYHDKLFSEGGDFSDARLLALAASLNLDQTRFQECLSSPKARKVVEASHRDAVEKGLEGAPAVFLNGVRISDPMDYDRLKDRITRLLETGAASSSQPAAK